MRFRLFFACVFLIASPLPAVAFGTGTPVTTDSRIKTFVYNENDVYRLLTHYGYQLNVEFGNKEEIETISVGDRTGWQIIPAESRLFIRAMEDKAHTNMTVVTNRHAYQFDLYSSPPGNQGWDELVYVVRFYYPETDSLQTAGTGMMGGYPMSPMPPSPVGYSNPAYSMPPAAPAAPMSYPAPAYSAPYGAAAPAPPYSAPYGNPYANPYANMAPSAGGPMNGMMPTSYNYNYSFTGEQGILPTQMYDDGQRTYLSFNEGQMLPQLFVVTPDHRESPLAVASSGQLITAQGVYPKIVLRMGNSSACIYNDTMNP